MGDRLEQVLGALNGVLGDYLVRRGNGLATTMTCAPRATCSPRVSAAARIVVLVHGVACTEHVWRFRGGEDYGTLLARDHGYTPYYVRYNSGLSVEANGVQLASLLEHVVARHAVPVEEVLLLGYSMGGLVLRSAMHAGGSWMAHVRTAIYLGTPHLGAPLERGGRAIARLLAAIPDPYTRLIAEIGNLRSAGVKDLGDAHPRPLSPAVRHYLIVGSLLGPRPLASILGDALVPVPSAAAGACGDPASYALPPDHVCLLPGIDHLTLAHDARVYAQIEAWCGTRQGVT